MSNLPPQSIRFASSSTSTANLIPSTALTISPTCTPSSLRSLGEQKQLGARPASIRRSQKPFGYGSSAKPSPAISLQPSIEAKSLPPLALDMTTDGDTLVRVAALKLLAEKKHPQTLDKLQHALSDYELPVRLTAIELLGQAGATAAQGRPQTTRHRSR